MECYQITQDRMSAKRKRQGLPRRYAKTIKEVIELAESLGYTNIQERVGSAGKVILEGNYGTATEALIAIREDIPENLYNAIFNN